MPSSPQGACLTLTAPAMRVEQAPLVLVQALRCLSTARRQAIQEKTGLPVSQEFNMTALSGKITAVRAISGEQQAKQRVEISFKAACRLPARTQAPEWLKDQVLKIEREVTDLREVGDPGDYLPLSVEESSRWLYPLQVAPAVCYGAMPENLAISLRWWKDEKGPEYQILANGRRITGTFDKTGNVFTANLPTASFFSSAPALPVEFTVTCDKMKAVCTVLPAGTPYARRLLLPAGEVYRVENSWYRLDILAGKEGGGIAAWHERGREIDHFQRPEHLIERPLEMAGHLDRFYQGWRPSEKMTTLAMSCTGIRREQDAARLFLEGVLDEGQILRTTVTCLVPDDLPLVVWQREFHFHTGKKPPEPDKQKEELPKEPIDEMMLMGMGFRGAWLTERNGASGSRMFSAYRDQLVTLRSAEVNRMLRCNGWRMSSGWAMVEHPERHDYTLYLFDRHRPPFLYSWAGAQTITLEPAWLPAPARAGDSCGFTLAISAGEVGGVSPNGGWVACRAALPDGGVRCGIIARLHDAVEPTARVTLGDMERAVPLTLTRVLGVGMVASAVVDFPAGMLSLPLSAVVGDIPARRPGVAVGTGGR